MKALLICPADRGNVDFLGRTRPLALTPVLGRSLIDLWIAELASKGATEVVVLAADRPEQVRHAVGAGEAWGVPVRVVPESRELTVDEARARHGGGAELHEVHVLDHLPDGRQLFTSPQSWFDQMRGILPTVARQRVGMREHAPGIWAHVRARIAPNARLEGPCWLGANACVRARAQVGPGTILEEGAYVDEGAEVRESFIGPATYVGSMVDLRRSLAWGRGLFNWERNSFVEVKDDFLLGELSHHAAHKRSTAWIARLLALLTLVISSPVVLVALLRRPRGTPLLTSHRAVRAPVTTTHCVETCVYHELNGVGGLWRRWPELWNIARGEWTWVGNRPLTPDQAARLDNDFERLWLSVPPGLLSLADAEGCADAAGDEARAHASFYAVQHNLRADWQILTRTLVRRPALS